LPSRKSVDSQIGGVVMVREGQVRSGRSIGWKGRYLREGTESMVKSWS
jgi:N-acyl-D-aspartate/D-glutamate deacylase